MGELTNCYNGGGISVPADTANGVSGPYSPWTKVGHSQQEWGVMIKHTATQLRVCYEKR